MKEIPEDDSSISEISILPDGRVFVFGASQQLLEVFDMISPGNPAVRSRIDRIGAGNIEQEVEPKKEKEGEIRVRDAGRAVAADRTPPPLL